MDGECRNCMKPPTLHAIPFCSQRLCAAGKNAKIQNCFYTVSARQRLQCSFQFFAGLLRQKFWSRTFSSRRFIAKRICKTLLVISAVPLDKWVHCFQSAWNFGQQLSCFLLSQLLGGRLAYRQAGLSWCLQAGLNFYHIAKGFLISCPFRSTIRQAYFEKFLVD